MHGTREPSALLFIELGRRADFRVIVQLTGKFHSEGQPEKR
jgi:hypothetical protein